jgi:hypothetical protein
LSGYSDWRLPNLKELASIVDNTRANPAISPMFIDRLAATFWTSSSNPGGPVASVRDRLCDRRQRRYQQRADELVLRSLRPLTGGPRENRTVEKILDPLERDAGRTPLIGWTESRVTGGLTGTPR